MCALDLLDTEGYAISIVAWAGARPQGMLFAQHATLLDMMLLLSSRLCVLWLLPAIWCAQHVHAGQHREEC